MHLTRAPRQSTTDAVLETTRLGRSRRLNGHNHPCATLLRVGLSHDVIRGIAEEFRKQRCHREITRTTTMTTRTMMTTRTRYGHQHASPAGISEGVTAQLGGMPRSWTTTAEDRWTKPLKGPGGGRPTVRVPNQVPCRRGNAIGKRRRK